MDSSETLTTPTSSRLPLELLQQIYNLLSPLDFDAARHTCRLWLFASLDKTLLTSQLILGGWQAAAEQDLQEASDHFRKRRRQNTGDATSISTATSVSPTLSVEWVLSKRLATETRLCPSWSGIWPSNWSSVTKELDRQVPIHGIQIPITKAPSVRGATPPLICTVSGCSKFVLLAQDRVVFIYSLGSFKAGVRPLTSIFCHRRIVNMSMDTSCGRYAVGLLLEGRIGVLCEVEIEKAGPPMVNRIHPSMSLSDFRNFDIRTTSRSHPRSSAPDQMDFDLSSPTRSRVHPRAEAYRRRGQALGRSGEVAFVRGTSLTLTDSNSHTGTGEEFNPPVPNASFHQFFPERYGGEHTNAALSQHYPFNNFDPITGTSVSIELGARKIYKNLCSIHDPPKSVAICPQRQCVAFGCNTGVELHWIDALRGCTLSRWFPLAAPSDYLYFVPPRDGEQRTSTTKLRLISSAAGPEEFVDADHYRAVPLSDGHILFTEPESGCLFLGSDKPGGPTKLQRKVVCLPPEGHASGRAPDCYAAGREMRWGVRIVVAYGPRILLYNLPPDEFQRARPTTPGFQVAQSDLAMDVAVDDSHREAKRLEGVLIHDVGAKGEVVQDISVDTHHGRLNVWLFLRSGEDKRKVEKMGMHVGWSASLVKPVSLFLG
ncbi:hypothetical protein GJ744_007557 [Endocarpon pusillum]|uniref:F-box domain-containing protein n=1 Tax=Endocarpon pusillum TaxID=364733 RepID=A0A8H7AMB9_9EURO|nr:hypothetical protein GJ744_007557 [Endocarpon pusillum]